jgi:hypothetical protein
MVKRQLCQKRATSSSRGAEAQPVTGIGRVQKKKLQSKRELNKQVMVLILNR